MFAGRVPGVRSAGLSPGLWESRRFVSGSPASFFFVAQPLRSQWDSHSWLSLCLQLSGTAVPGCAPLTVFSLGGHDFSRAEEFEESSRLQPRVLHLSSLWNSHSWLFAFDCIVPSFVLCRGAARPARFSCSPDGYLVYVAPGFLPVCGSPDDLCREARHLSFSWHSHSVPSGTAILGCLSASS